MDDWKAVDDSDGASTISGFSSEPAGDARTRALLAGLKATIKKERGEAKSLQEKMRERDQQFRVLELEAQGLKFRNTQLQKQIGTLQTDLQQATSSKKSKNNKQKQKPEVDNVALEVLQDELHLKIQENAELHVQVSDLRSQQDHEMTRLRQRVIEVEDELVAVRQATAARVSAQKTPAVVQQDKRDEQRKSREDDLVIANTRLQHQLKLLSAESETRIKTTAAEIARLERELTAARTLIKGHIHFDDTVPTDEELSVRSAAAADKDRDTTLAAGSLFLRSLAACIPEASAVCQVYNAFATSLGPNWSTSESWSQLVAALADFVASLSSETDSQLRTALGDLSSHLADVTSVAEWLDNLQLHVAAFSAIVERSYEDTDPAEGDRRVQLNTLSQAATRLGNTLTLPSLTITPSPLKHQAVSYLATITSKERPALIPAAEARSLRQDATVWRRERVALLSQLSRLNARLATATAEREQWLLEAQVRQVRYEKMLASYMSVSANEKPVDDDTQLLAGLSHKYHERLVLLTTSLQAAEGELEGLRADSAGARLSLTAAVLAEEQLRSRVETVERELQLAEEQTSLISASYEVQLASLSEHSASLTEQVVTQTELLEQALLRLNISGKS